MSLFSQTTDATGPGLPLFHFRLVGKLALAVSAVTGLVLVGVVIGTAQKGGTGYSQIIEAFSATRHNLGLAFILSGLGVVSVAGVLAWLITVYASFRVAGPLYRFARNLELVAASGPVSVPGIRAGDCLQDDARDLAEGVAALRRHYDEIRTLVERAEGQLQSSSAEDREALAATILQLKKIDGERIQ